MSSPRGGKLHLWFWVTTGVFLYVASCPPVEAWHDKRLSGNAFTTTVSGAPPARGVRHGTDFEVVEVSFVSPVPRPKWMQYLYAPVHFVEQYPPFAAVFQRYRFWCENWF